MYGQLAIQKLNKKKFCVEKAKYDNLTYHNIDFLNLVFLKDY